MKLVGVGHLPCPAGSAVVVGHGFFGRGVLGLVGVKRISVLVLGTTNFTGALPGIDLEDGVLGSIDIGIDPHAEEMLMVVGVDTGVDFGSPAFGVFARVHGVGVEDAGKLDLKLNGTVLMEDPVYTVFVVGRGEDVGDEKLPATCDYDGVIPEIGVLEENAGILFVDAYGILDGGACPSSVDKVCVHIVNGTLAVTSESQAVSHVTSTVLAKVESMFPLMRVLRVSVWDNHLRERQPIKGGSLVAFVIVRDVVEHNAFTVVEAHVDAPILPVNNTTIDLERHAFRLSDVDWLDIFPVPSLGLDRRRIIIARRSFVHGSSYRRDIDVIDLLCLGVVDWDEVEREGILAVIWMRSVVHQALLKPDGTAKALVITDCPRCYRSVREQPYYVFWTHGHSKPCAYPP